MYIPKYNNRYDWWSKLQLVGSDYVLFDGVVKPGDNFKPLTIPNYINDLPNIFNEGCKLKYTAYHQILWFLTIVIIVRECRRITNLFKQY